MSAGRMIAADGRLLAFNMLGVLAPRSSSTAVFRVLTFASAGWSIWCWGRSKLDARRSSELVVRRGRSKCP